MGRDSFLFFSLCCLLLHLHQRQAWRLETTGLASGPEEGRGVWHPFSASRDSASWGPLLLWSHFLIIQARQGHVRGSTAAWLGPPAPGLGSVWLAPARGVRRSESVGTASGLVSREGSEGQSLADFPGGLQKYICLFDLISKPSRESLGNGGGRRKVSSSPFSLSLLMSLLSIFSQRQCFLLCDTYHVFLLLLGCLAVVTYDGWVGMLGLN